MGEKKYILIDETFKVDGRTLHRIKAVKDFEDVKVGDLGGFIEKEENLSHERTCWVYDEACVCNKAKVFGEASIADQYNILQIPNIGSRKDTTTFFKTSTGKLYVACGCFKGTIEEFEKAVERTHGKNEHGRVYKAAIQMAKITLI